MKRIRFDGDQPRTGNQRRALEQGVEIMNSLVIRGLLTLSVLLIASGAVFAQAVQAPQSRAIEMVSVTDEPLPGAFPQIPPQGTVNVTNNSEQFGDFLHLTVRGLTDVAGNDVYAIYVTQAASAADYVPGTAIVRVLFNVDFQGTWQRFDGGVASDLPTLTAFVVREEDDGLEFNEGGNDTLIMEGTSTLP